MLAGRGNSVRARQNSLLQNELNELISVGQFKMGELASQAGSHVGRTSR